MSVHPRFGRHINERNLLKRTMQSMLVSADDIMLTEAEVEANDAQARKDAANAPPDPETMKIEMQRAIAQQDAEIKMAIAEMNLEGDYMRLVAQGQMKREDAEARLAAIREQNASRERQFAAEAAIEASRPPGSPGSGGFLSAPGGGSG